MAEERSSWDVHVHFMFTMFTHNVHNVHNVHLLFAPGCDISTCGHTRTQATQAACVQVVQVLRRCDMMICTSYIVDLYIIYNIIYIYICMMCMICIRKLSCMSISNDLYRYRISSNRV